MSFLLVPKSVTLNGLMAVILQYFSVFCNYTIHLGVKCTLKNLFLVVDADIYTESPLVRALN